MDFSINQSHRKTHYYRYFKQWGFITGIGSKGVEGLAGAEGGGGRLCKMNKRETFQGEITQSAGCLVSGAPPMEVSRNPWASTPRSLPLLLWLSPLFTWPGSPPQLCSQSPAGLSPLHQRLQGDAPSPPLPSSLPTVLLLGPTGEGASEMIFTGSQPHTIQNTTCQKKIWICVIRLRHWLTNEFADPWFKGSQKVYQAHLM